MALLSDTDLQSGLRDLPHWHHTGDHLTRRVQATTYLTALDLLHTIGLAAEDIGHHPDITLRWRTLDLALTTHDEGGITTHDLALARVIDDLVDRHAVQ